MGKFLGLMLVGVALLQSPAVAGGTDGPRSARGVVEAEGFEVFDGYFKRGELAQARLKGYGATILHIVVYDDNFNVVAQGNDRFGETIISWQPPRTGHYWIAVYNPSSVGQRFFFSHN